MDQTQSQQTEKLIEEMLEFLESASDDEENLNDNKIIHDEGFAKEIFENNGKNLKELTTRSGFDKLQGKKSTKSTIGKELKKLKEEFPVWNTQEIVSNKNAIYSLPPSTNGFEEPLWNSESMHSIEKPSESLVNEENHQKDDYKDWYKQSGDDNNRSEEIDDDDIFVQEVHRAIYGDIQGHPTNGSPEYFEAAQNYALYGKDFLDFPENLHNIIKGGRGVNGLMENGNANSDQYMGNQEFPDENCLDAAQNNFGKATCNIATSISNNSAAAAPTVAAVASSTAAYYQLCNGMQQRPGSSNSATYGMFLGNKVTYMAAAPSAPTLVYNQQTATTGNFVSNSLANAALATSPTILYSNPMLNATTQQYLNAFFKETQLLNSAGNSNQANATTTGFYERLVYAQMLQQQIYNQNQAAAFAAMIQHKQRVNAAAVAAAAAAAAAIAARQTTSASNANATNANQSNGLPTSTSNASGSGVTPGAAGTTSSTSSSVAFPPLNQCGRQASMVSNNTSDIIAMKQQGTAVANQQPAITINSCDKISNGNKE